MLSAPTEVFRAMLLAQNDLNNQINPDWKHLNLPFPTAIWMECAELVDCYQWKWWSKEPADASNIITELVDIWCFGLSIILYRTTLEPESLDTLSNELEHTYRACAHSAANDPTPAFQLIELIAGNACGKKFNEGLFFNLLYKTGTSFEEFTAHYFSKIALNEFRQTNGIANGNYIKHWLGHEDNEVLRAILPSHTDTLIAPEEDVPFTTHLSHFFFGLTDELTAIYNECLEESDKAAEIMLDLFGQRPEAVTEIPEEIIERDPPEDIEEAEQSEPPTDEETELPNTQTPTGGAETSLF